MVLIILMILLKVLINYIKRTRYYKFIINQTIKMIITTINITIIIVINIIILVSSSSSLSTVLLSSSSNNHAFFIIIAGQDQVDTSKLKNMLRLKVFIAPVYLPLDHHIKCSCCDCYCYCELCNNSEAISSMPTPTCSDYFESFCLTIFRHCSVWLSCCCCCRGISCSTIVNSLQQEFQIKHSIQYDGVTFKFWKLPGYLGVRIDGNEKKVALELDKFVRIENVLTKKQYAVCVTDVYDER